MRSRRKSRKTKDDEDDDDGDDDAFMRSCALILGCCKCRRTDLSLEIFETMIEKGHMPNETTYTIIVEGIAHENETELAAKVLKDLRVKQVVSQSTVERLVMQYDLDGLPI